MEEINSNNSVREDILGGLKLAVSKGESLQQAMQSLYNSGYAKGDIEKSARELQKFNISTQPSREDMALIFL